MSKNWSKVFLVSMLVLMVGASLALATTSRVRSLGNVGDYVSDDSNVNRWYSTLSHYGNQVNAELGTFNAYGYGYSLGDTRGLGWTHTCGTKGTYRISFNENAVDHPGFWMVNPLMQTKSPDSAGNLFGFGGGSAGTPINGWDIAGGWEVNENINVGLSFTRNSWKWESTTPDTTLKSTWTTFGAGLTWSNNEDMMFDFAATFAIAGGKNEFGPTSSFEYDSKNAMDLAARLMWDWKDDVTVPIVAEFCTSDYSIKTTPAGGVTPPDGDKMTSFMIGGGFNMDVNTDNKLIFAVELGSSKWEFSNPGGSTGADTLAEIKSTMLPGFRLGLETAITSHITTRIGATKYLGTTKYTSNTGKEITDSPGSDGYFVPWAQGYSQSSRGGGPSNLNGNFGWYLGAGFNVAEWTVDAELSHQTPFSLGYWLTGYTAWDQGDTGPILRLSGVYNY